MQIAEAISRFICLWKTLVNFLFFSPKTFNLKPKALLTMLLHNCISQALPLD